jgi:translation initiation factor 3 subunit G
VIANKDGTKTVISYRYNDDNKKVKVTRRIKTTVVRENVNPHVAERRKWEKFGQEKGHAAGPSFDTTSVGENLIFRPSVNWKANAKEAEKEGGEKGSMKDQLKDKKVKCRICSGEHFTARCPFKDTMAPVEEGTAGAGAGAGADAEEDVGGLGAGKSSYVPPHMRKGGTAGGEKMGGRFEKDDLATLRVTNVCFAIFLSITSSTSLLLVLVRLLTIFRGIQVSELAEENELRDLFERFGRVTRVFLARDRETQRAKGFAFISYADRGDAALACEKVDGCMFSTSRFVILPPSVPQMLTSSASSRLPPPHSPCRVRQAFYLNFFFGFLLRLLNGTFPSSQAGLLWAEALFLVL